MVKELTDVVYKLKSQEMEKNTGKGEQEIWRSKQKYPAPSTPFASQFLHSFFLPDEKFV